MTPDDITLFHQQFSTKFGSKPTIKFALLNLLSQIDALWENGQLQNITYKGLQNISDILKEIYKASSDNSVI